MTAHPASHLGVLRPPVADVVLVGVLAVLVVPTMASMLGQWGLIGSALFLVPLLWRRTLPDAAALALVVPHLAQLTFVGTPLTANITVPIMIFSLAAHGDPRYRPWWLVGSAAAALAAAVSWTNGVARLQYDSGWSLLRDAGMAFVLLLSVVAASWALGALARSLVETRRSTEERTRAVEAQRLQQTQLDVVQERQRIAREMHDIVAHSLAVVVVQADGGAYAASHGSDASVRLATAEKALRTIRDTAQEALEETRRLVGVLRSDESSEWRPAGGLGEVFDLVTGVRNAGRSVHLQVTGDPGLRARLGHGLEQAAYRIVQESLTNTVKHAGEDATVLVSIDHGRDALTVQVRDNGRGTGSSDGQGHGLVGMRERVAAFGGVLEAGNHPDGGFVVIARFPTP